MWPDMWTRGWSPLLLPEGREERSQPPQGRSSITPPGEECFSFLFYQEGTGKGILPLPPWEEEVISLSLLLKKREGNFFF